MKYPDLFRLRKALIAFALFIGTAAGQVKPMRPLRAKPETPHFRFVKEYVRELVDDESLKENGEKELSEAKTPNEQFSNGIYVGKFIQLELRSQIAMVKSMRLNDPFDTLIQTLVASYQRQIELHQKLIDISGKFLAGPKEGVDYEALAAKVPDIRAELDQARKTVFDAVPLLRLARRW